MVQALRLKRPLYIFCVLALLDTLRGTAGDTWDASWNVSTLPFPATALRLEDVEMQRVLLYPPNSAFVFLPAAYYAPASAASLSLLNCTIFTQCSTVQAYTQFTAASTNMKSSNSSSCVALSRQNTLEISRCEYTSAAFNASLVNVTLLCSSGDTPAPAQAFASNTMQLVAALNAMSIVNVSSGNTLQLQGTVHANYTTYWPLEGISVGPGVLTITSSPGSRAIVDLDMNMNVISVLTGPIHLVNLTLVNLCTKATVLQGYTLYSAFAVSAFRTPPKNWGSSNSSNKPLTVQNSTVAVPRFEMHALMYWTALYPSKFQSLNAYAAIFTNAYPDNPPVGYALNEDELLVSFSYDSLSYTDVIMHAADAQFLAQYVDPPTLCSAGEDKTPVPASILADNSLNPLYAISTADNLTSALQQAAIRRWMYPPVMLLFHNISVDPIIAGLTLSFDVLIAGPTTTLSVPAGSPTSMVLDLQQLPAAAISLGGSSAGLFMQRLTLVNPCVSSVTANGQSSASALPLWGVQFNRSQGTRILLNSVTLVLPVASFAPLYALAKAGGLSKLAAARQGPMQRWAALMDPVLDLITSFDVNQFSTSAISLSKYEGWGVNATMFVIQAAALYVDDEPVASADDDSSSSNSTHTILIITMTLVGCLVVIVVGALWYRRRSKLLTPPASKNSDAEEQPVKIRFSSEAGIAGKTSSGSAGSVCAATMQSLTTDAPSSSGWDPMKEVQMYAGMVQAKEEDSLQLLEPIGTGGFGTVYRGRWRNLDVAVKTVLFTCKDGSQNAPERQAIKEAAVCTSIIHPNVVATFHYDIRPVQALPSSEGAMQIQDHAQPRDWKMYLVQELCHSSLADALASGFFHHQGSNLPKQDLVLCTLLDIAKGLEYIHGKNIIHGDLKPENVLLKVEPSGAHGVISKITDFGLCSTLDPSKSHVSCFNGTPFYAAPEIAASGKTTTLSDVFSFGILMVEVYRRDTPWIRTPNGFQPNDGFLVFHERVPAAYLALIDRCLQHDPKKRPDMSEIRAAIQALMPPK